MKGHILLLVIIELILLTNTNSQVLNFPFKTLKTTEYTSMDTKEISERVTIQRMYTSISVGTPPQKLNLNIEMNHPYLSIISKKFSDDITNIPFDINKTTTLKNRNESKTISLDVFMKDDAKEGKYDVDTVEETLILDNKKIEKMIFYIVTNDYKSGIFDINSGAIGLDLNRNENPDAEYDKFMNRLKEFGGIGNYNFYIIYENKDKDEGKLVLGALPNETNTELNKYQLNKVYTDFKSSLNGLRWGISFLQLNITANNKLIVYDNCNALNFTFSTFDNCIRFHYILYQDKFKELMQSYIDKQLCKEEVLFNGTVISYNCINDPSKINFNLFPSIKFYHKELNSTFELNFGELHEIVNNRVYWLVQFYKSGLIHNKPVLGKPFLKKYINRFYFNYDNKIISYFTDQLTEKERKKKEEEEEEKRRKSKRIKNFLIVFFISLALLILVVILGVIIYKKRDVLCGRKARAGELNDDYVYVE